MANGNGVKLPFRLNDLLSGAYYAIAITASIIGLLAWTIHQQTRIDYLEQREKEHPTKTELSETAIRIDNRITGLEQTDKNYPSRIESLSTRLDLRLQELAKEQGTQDQRTLLIEERQGRVIKDLQAMNERIDRIVQALDSAYSRLNDFIDAYNRTRAGGERGPTYQTDTPPNRRPRYKSDNGNNLPPP
jgi:chaperonin cofactor prefoldin